MFPPLIIAAVGAAVAYVLFKPENKPAERSDHGHESDSQDGGGRGGDNVHRLPGEFPSSNNRGVNPADSVKDQSTTENVTDSGSEKSLGKEKEHGSASQIPKTDNGSLSGE